MRFKHGRPNNASGYRLGNRPTDLGNFDALFVVSDADRRMIWHIGASYESSIGYQQWGAPREVLGFNVDLIERWAKELAREEGD